MRRNVNILIYIPAIDICCDGICLTIYIADD